MHETLKIAPGPSFAHRVYGNLWIGNAPPVISAHENNTSDLSTLSDFDVLVLCAMEYQLGGAMFPVEEVIHAPMDDAFRPVNAETANVASRAARIVISRLMRGKRVLVTCFAGRNRSGLVCALALCFGQKMPVDKAVGLIRAARGRHALANPFFVEFVRSVARQRDASVSGRCT